MTSLRARDLRQVVRPVRFIVHGGSGSGSGRNAVAQGVQAVARVCEHAIFRIVVIAVMLLLLRRRRPLGCEVGVQDDGAAARGFDHYALRGAEAEACGGGVAGQGGGLEGGEGGGAGRGRGCVAAGDGGAVVAQDGREVGVGEVQREGRVRAERRHWRGFWSAISRTWVDLSGHWRTGL